jgi:hypothetical protein
MLEKLFAVGFLFVMFAGLNLFTDGAFLRFVVSLIGG